MNAFLQDFRYALRMLRKSPGLTLVVILSLAIGIGANTAVFSVVNALLLRPLPYPHPDRLAAIWLHSPALGIFRDWPSPGEYIDVQNENRSFEEMSLSQVRNYILTRRDHPERVSGMRTTSTLLDMLGAKPYLGRLLRPNEDKPGQPPAVVLTYGGWQRFFNADPHELGRTVRIDAQPYTVVGVLTQDFRLDSEVMESEGPVDNLDFFLPMPLGPDAVRNRGDENYNIVVRLKRGVSIAQAQADVDGIAARIRVKDKRDRTFGMTVMGLQDMVVGDVRRALLVVLGSVTLVLLIACANVANLLLARSAGRQKEAAIRTALGAGGVRILRQLLTESILLGVLGGGAGLALARLTIQIVRVMNPGNIPRLAEIQISGPVLAFTFAVALLTGILFGIAPAWRAAKVDVNASLKAGGRSGQGDGGLKFGRNRLRGLLVVSELALSLMLLIGAGLLIRSFVRLQAVSPGFEPDHVLSMFVLATGPRYNDRKSVVAFDQEISSRIAHLPGVSSEGMVNPLPMTGEISWGGINVEGWTPPPGQELQVDQRTASAGYFRTMKIPLLKGRFFSDSDTMDTQQVAIIDRKFADRFWPRESPIGRHLWWNPKKPVTIVGVVGTVKQYGLDVDSKMVVYFPNLQNTDSGAHLVVRTPSEPAMLAGAITREIHSVDPDALVYDVRTMQDRVHESLARQRFSTTMLGAFAGFALLLAVVGVYGVMSSLVSQGTRDIGVRLALGAQARDILALIVRQGMGLAAAGMLLGLAGALALTRVMNSLLFGVSATDALTFVSVAIVLAGAAFAATVVPATRASRVDPVVSLREE